MSHIQAVDGIFHIVRIFENADVIHVDDCVDPVRDIETINAELCSKDLVFVKQAMAEEAKAVRSSKFKLSAVFTETMDKMVAMLEANKPIRSGEWSTEEVHIINEKTRLITTEPMIYLLNMTMTGKLSSKTQITFEKRTSGVGFYISL